MGRTGNHPQTYGTSLGSPRLNLWGFRASASMALFSFSDTEPIGLIMRYCSPVENAYTPFPASAPWPFLAWPSRGQTPQRWIHRTPRRPGGQGTGWDAESPAHLALVSEPRLGGLALAARPLDGSVAAIDRAVALRQTANHRPGESERTFDFLWTGLIRTI